MYLNNILAQYFPNCDLQNIHLLQDDQSCSKYNGFCCQISLRSAELNKAKEIPIYNTSQDI